MSTLSQLHDSKVVYTLGTCYVLLSVPCCFHLIIIQTGSSSLSLKCSRSWYSSSKVSADAGGISRVQNSVEMTYRTIQGRTKASSSQIPHRPSSPTTSDMIQSQAISTHTAGHRPLITSVSACPPPTPLPCPNSVDSAPPNRDHRRHKTTRR